MIRINSDSNGDTSTTRIEMSGTGLEMLAEALTLVKRLADAFESRGGRFVRTMFIEMLKDDEFWGMNIDVDDDKEAEDECD